MIRKIRADRASFKTLEFRPGLNILRADKEEGASDRDSRNGAGKTSFVELVHFLFGASVPQKSIFRSAALADWRFEGELEIEGRLGGVVRSGAKPGTVETSGALAAERAGQPRLLGATPRPSQQLEDWKALLGDRWFGLEPGGEGPFRPSFRSLLSYLIRRQERGGFQDCRRHSTLQPPWDAQVSVSRLLGLDWTIAQRFQGIREREKNMRALKKAAESGELGHLARGAAALRTDLTLARAKAQKMKERLDQFRVLPDHEDLEKEATRITKEISALRGENIADRGLVEELEGSLTDEQEPGKADLLKVYREAGVVLPELAHRRLGEVDLFHRRVIENRRAHLKAEIESARDRIADREARKAELDRRRRQVMEILQSGGALAEYTAMREEVARVEAEVQALKERLRDVERLETLRGELKAERARATRALRDDIRERDAILQKAILRFEELSQSLYEHSGRLVIDGSENGPKFDVQIPSGQSRGIANMQIFCFDLMLMELQVERGRSPGFLIHDSHLFDGVDERQVARALQLGARRAEAAGFQYIVTMNTDAIPREGFDPGFVVQDYFTGARLTDASETGGLFGVRFDWPPSSAPTGASDAGGETQSPLFPA